ncbi:MAG: class I SAM-dependent methyltransferase [Terriglobales bacterium]
MAKLMKELEDLPKGFSEPTALPANREEQQVWQNANRNWWESHPMRYDWKDGIRHEEFSKEFFTEIDRRFFDAVELYAPCKKIPFDWLIDFDTLKTKDVLEIGVGNGSHAQLLAERAKSFSGIDLTEYAVKSTTERIRVFELGGKVLRMDAEQMQFPDSSFDLIWTWGVIHHSANTRKILEEMHRVLRPGGEAIVMVYHRTFWEYYVQGAMLAIFAGQIFDREALHASIQRRTDGAIARYYKRAEWERLVSDLFVVKDSRVYGKKTELVPLPAGGVKNLLVGMVPNACSRFLTNTCKWGSFLVTRLRKEAV